ncbi:MAG: hypothetical protein DWQ37_06425 [Planctomycetota bacterium]|nr:MAG: hypothetical protein DWQ37_06425 [Planctomycetota bacterium]
MFVCGCTSAKQESAEHDDHGHSHDHEHADAPESLPVAIVELRKNWEAISQVINGSDSESAHDRLHDVGTLLEAMPDLAAETDLPESEWNEIKSEADKLLDAFGDIDLAFHKEDGDRVAAYDAAKSTIDEGIAALEAKLPLLEQHASTSDHDSNPHRKAPDHHHDDEDHAAAE